MDFVVGYLSECSGEVCLLFFWFFFFNLEELPDDVKMKGLLKYP